jgi:hypothetical protein
VSSVELVVNAGSTFWEVIDGDKPAVDISSVTANAIPAGAEYTELSAPAGTGRIYRQVVDWNARGDQVAHVGWNLNWHYGSTYRGGGAFIPNCWLSIAGTPEIQRGWSVRVSVRFGLPSLLDAGTGRAVAALPVTMTRRLRSLGGVTDELTVYELVLYGDGRHAKR